jgi:hypothetical protein
VGHWGHAFEGYILALAHLVIPLFFFGCHEVSSLCLTLLPPYSASLQTQSNGSGQPWTETSKTMSQNKYFLLFKLFPQVFITVTKS